MTVSTPGMKKCPCLSCGEHIEYPSEYEGMKFACPHCGQATLLKTSAASTVKLPESAVPAPPAMGSMSPTSTTLAPPPMGSMSLSSADASAVPDPSSSPDQESDPCVCENCGAAMVTEDKVCVECGHRRPSVSKWNGTAVFRLMAGILLLVELAVLGLQWTTEGEPFGLRKRTRHAVLVKLGFEEEAVKPSEGGTNGVPMTATATVKDSDLKLKSHAIETDKDNGTLWIKGVVENISKYRYLGLRVRFDLKNAAGNVIPDGEVSAYHQSLEPGKEWTFKVLLLDPEATDYVPILPIKGVR